MMQFRDTPLIARGVSKNVTICRNAWEDDEHALRNQDLEAKMAGGKGLRCTALVSGDSFCSIRSSMFQADLATPEQYDDRIGGGD